MLNVIPAVTAGADMPIYTKNGDNGTTSIANGQKFEKSDDLIWALGTADELNASLGIMHTSRDKIIKDIVLKIQSDLLLIGAFLSGLTIKNSFATKIVRLEETIDKLELKLPRLTKFILPGGTKYSAHLHLARAICRRLERSLAETKKHNFLDKTTLADIMKYTNRLSDLLFVLARYANFKFGVKDIEWKNEDDK